MVRVGVCVVRDKVSVSLKLIDNSSVRSANYLYRQCSGGAS